MTDLQKKALRERATLAQDDTGDNSLLVRGSTVVSLLDAVDRLEADLARARAENERYRNALVNTLYALQYANDVLEGSPRVNNAIETVVAALATTTHASCSFDSSGNQCCNCERCVAENGGLATTTEDKST